MRLLQTTAYLRDLRRLGVTENEARAIDLAIAANPEAGKVVKGLGGIRKLRFAFGGRGKRGGGRVVYFLMAAEDTAALLFAYAKNEQEDLTPAQRKLALRLMEEIRNG